MVSQDLNNTYLVIEETKDFFPRFKFSKYNIPIGNSMKLCISLHWTTNDKGKNFDLTEQVEGFPPCFEAQSGKFIWNDDDPITGIDVPSWIQIEHDVDCTDDDDCQSACDYYDALYLNGIKGKKCYGY